MLISQAISFGELAKLYNSLSKADSIEKEKKFFFLCFQKLVEALDCSLDPRIPLSYLEYYLSYCRDFIAQDTAIEYANKLLKKVKIFF